MEIYHNLKLRFQEIEGLDLDEVDINDFEQKVFDLEDEVKDAIEFSFSNEKKELKKLLKKIVEFKAENDFYNAEDELKRMFPDRDDDDFNEDSTSYDSVFGKD